MGQAIRRKRALGPLYGTQAGSNRGQGFGAPTLQLRHLTEDEAAAELEALWDGDPGDRPDAIATIGGHVRATEHPPSLLLATLGSERRVVVAWPTTDAARRFNTHLVALGGPGSPLNMLHGWRRIRDQRAINQFLLDSADVVLMEGEDGTAVAYTRRRSARRVA